MKNIYVSLLVMLSLLCSSTVVRAAGESRSEAIEVAQAGTWTLNGAKDVNTTTWFKILPEALGDADMISLQITGDNCGAVDIFVNDEADAVNTLIITDASKNPLVKQYWYEGTSAIYVAVMQDNANGQATFGFSHAQPGEVKEKALATVVGSNTVGSAFSPVWYSFTSTEDKIYFLSSSAVTFSEVRSAETGLSICPANLLNVEGFRLPEGDKVYFRVLKGSGNFVLHAQDILPGMFPDKPFDITDINSFAVDIPADPNASDDGAAQIERYWTFTASKSGVLMWGTSDADWMKGMWGVSVIDQTDNNRRLSTPLTRVEMGMLTYQVNVQAGHTYMISQVLGCSRSAHTVTVRVALNDGAEGDTKENAIPLALNTLLDLGRKTANTKYYRFTAEQDGMYTATIHAGGQVRATTPQDGTWTIMRDYSIQERQMHIDKEIALAAGESLLLEITLTSDIDIHTNGSDAEIPNYSILITQNEEEEKPEVREGEDVEHAIAAVASTPYPLYQSSAEDYYERYYRVEVPAGMTLVITTHHTAAAGTPSPINFTLNGKSWNEVKYTTTILTDEADKKVGREYVVEPLPEDRVIFVETDGVSFLYEGATWQYEIVGDETAIDFVPVYAGAKMYYNLSGQRIAAPTKKGLYIVNRKKVLR